MKITHARTGLKLEKGLYNLACKSAAEKGMSFAAYVVDLLACELMEHKDSQNLPDIKRFKGIAQTLRQKRDLEEIKKLNQHVETQLTEGLPMQEQRRA